MTGPPRHGVHRCWQCNLDVATKRITPDGRCVVCNPPKQKATQQ